MQSIIKAPKFQLPLTQAKQAFSQWAFKHIYAPLSFKAQHNNNNNKTGVIEASYLPFYLFSYNTKFRYSVSQRQQQQQYVTRDEFSERNVFICGSEVHSAYVEYAMKPFVDTLVTNESEELVVPSNNDWKMNNINNNIDFDPNVHYTVDNVVMDADYTWEIYHEDDTYVEQVERFCQNDYASNHGGSRQSKTESIEPEDLSYSTKELVYLPVYILHANYRGVDTNTYLSGLAPAPGVPPFVSGVSPISFWKTFFPTGAMIAGYDYLFHGGNVLHVPECIPYIVLPAAAIAGVTHFLSLKKLRWAAPNSVYTTDK
jgi:hypothetical protein